MKAPSDAKTASSFPSLLQDFFCKRLICQRNVTARTVTAYRDTFRLMLLYAQSQLHRPPVTITLAELDAPFVLGYFAPSGPEPQPAPSQPFVEPGRRTSS